MWEATRIPNLFTLDGRYYGRVKVKGKSLRKSFDTSSLAVARAKLRDWLLNMAIVKDAPGGTFGGMIEPYRGWLEGQKINEDIGQSTIDYKRMNLQLPEAEKLLELRNEVYRRCQVQGSFGGWLFDFILFSGCRIDSANHICWEDVRCRAATPGQAEPADLHRPRSPGHSPARAEASTPSVTRELAELMLLAGRTSPGR